ncbi:hypothetical protein MHZ92_04515 [Sporosarcina sp. ACRSL]|uniref:hypothetical protein n=1 Tax=Sporosarcina sp. ACRSL TaxID=2918215 RepID=UPI001EF69518|nr:hypothetical protein [Sporosarcina sp. ACRSL]MCG7343381.1 hypothetical protein [Sporosarcina sp. ACRSL]
MIVANVACAVDVVEMTRRKLLSYNESRHEERLLRVKAKRYEHIFALTVAVTVK